MPTKPLVRTWYFRAPDSVLKQLAAAEHGTLSYSLKQSTDAPGFLDDDVIIVGPAGRLSFRFGTSPGSDWTPFAVTFTAAAGWRWNWNARATQEQIQSRARQSDEPRNPRRVPDRTR